MSETDIVLARIISERNAARSKLTQAHSQLTRAHAVLKQAREAWERVNGFGRGDLTAGELSSLVSETAEEQIQAIDDLTC